MPDIFTEQERPYLSRQKKKKDYTNIIIVLLFLFFIALMVDVVFKFTTVHAQVTEPSTEMSDKQMYDTYDGETKELCTNYLATH